MAEKYFLFSLDDNKTKKLGEVISNPTSKKIANLLAEKEFSESDLSKALNLPLNTIEYNLKKLIEAGIAEKSKEYFWSAKGRKIPTYKIANKLIVISPKKSSSIYSKLKGIAPIVIISAIFTALISWMQKVSNFSDIDKVKDEIILQTASSGESAAASSLAEPSSQIAQEAIKPFMQNWQIALIFIWAIILIWVIYIIAKKEK